jgi:hypothetical protein
MCKSTEGVGIVIYKGRHGIGVGVGLIQILIIVMVNNNSCGRARRIVGVGRRIVGVVINIIINEFCSHGIIII